VTDTLPRLRPGAREMTPEERAELRKRQQALEAASSDWLSSLHAGAKRHLCEYVAGLADGGVPFTRMARTMGVTTQRVHQQAVAGRMTRPHGGACGCETCTVARRG
jgi:hypothetical protein